MARSIWKGAISFGLVHIPVAVVSAASRRGIDFDWLDDRSMDPVGYKRVNKVTGKEVPREHIVKGVQYEKGQYVVLSEDEIREAHPASTQTIDIFAFVERAAIPFTYIDTPYYLNPQKRGEKVYALLRRTLENTEQVALAHVVLHTRQYLAAVMTLDAALVLVTLRWPTEMHDVSELDLDAVKKPELSRAELDMAKKLVKDMSTEWEPEQYRDSFDDKLMALVERKAREGKIEAVETNVDTGERRSADIIDLTELLKRSLGGKSGGRKDVATAKKTASATHKTSARKKPARKNTTAKSAAGARKRQRG
jgi:DNA end-binding protein Ku